MSELVDSPDDTLYFDDGYLMVFCDDEWLWSGGWEWKMTLAKYVVDVSHPGMKVYPGREERVERWLAKGRLKFGSKWNPLKLIFAEEEV